VVTNRLRPSPSHRTLARQPSCLQQTLEQEEIQRPLGTMDPSDRTVMGGLKKRLPHPPYGRHKDTPTNPRGVSSCELPSADTRANPAQGNKIRGPMDKPDEHFEYLWCLLFVLIRQGLRGGSGPQHWIRSLGEETGNPIMAFHRPSFFPSVERAPHHTV